MSLLFPPEHERASSVEGGVLSPRSRQVQSLWAAGVGQAQREDAGDLSPTGGLAPSSPSKADLTHATSSPNLEEQQQQRQRFFDAEVLRYGDEVRLWACSEYALAALSSFTEPPTKGDLKAGGYVGVYFKGKKRKSRTGQQPLAAVPPIGPQADGVMFESRFRCVDPKGLRTEGDPVRLGDEVLLVDGDGHVWNTSTAGVVGYLTMRLRGERGELRVRFARDLSSVNFKGGRCYANDHAGWHSEGEYGDDSAANGSHHHPHNNNFDPSSSQQSYSAAYGGYGGESPGGPVDKQPTFASSPHLSQLHSSASSASLTAGAAVAPPAGGTATTTTTSTTTNPPLPHHHPSQSQSQSQRDQSRDESSPSPSLAVAEHQRLPSSSQQTSPRSIRKSVRLKSASRSHANLKQLDAPLVRFGDALWLVSCPRHDETHPGAGRNMRKEHVLTNFKRETSSTLGGYLTVDPRGYATQFVVSRAPPTIDKVCVAGASHYNLPWGTVVPFEVDPLVEGSKKLSLSLSNGGVAELDDLGRHAKDHRVKSRWGSLLDLDEPAENHAAGAGVLVSKFWLRLSSSTSTGMGSVLVEAAAVFRSSSSSSSNDNFGGGGGDTSGGALGSAAAAAAASSRQRTGTPVLPGTAAAGAKASSLLSGSSSSEEGGKLVVGAEPAPAPAPPADVTSDVVSRAAVAFAACVALGNSPAARAVVAVAACEGWWDPAGRPPPYARIVSSVAALVAAAVVAPLGWTLCAVAWAAGSVTFLATTRSKKRQSEVSSSERSKLSSPWKAGEVALLSKDTRDSSRGSSRAIQADARVQGELVLVEWSPDSTLDDRYHPFARPASDQRLLSTPPPFVGGGPGGDEHYHQRSNSGDRGVAFASTTNLSAAAAAVPPALGSLSSDPLVAATQAQGQGQGQGQGKEERHNNFSSYQHHARTAPATAGFPQKRPASSKAERVDAVEVKAIAELKGLVRECAFAPRWLEDGEILRFVRARKTIDERAELYREAMAWRSRTSGRRADEVDVYAESFKEDPLLGSFGCLERAWCAKAQTPPHWWAFLSSHLPFELYGEDRSGLPVTYLSLGRMDLAGVAREVGIDRLEHKIVMQNDMFLDIARERRLANGEAFDNDNDDATARAVPQQQQQQQRPCSSTTTTTTSDWRALHGGVFIIDCDGMGRRHLTEIRVFKRVSAALKVLHPERQRKTFIVRAPRIFTAIWRLIKPMLDARTISKINILGVNDSLKPLFDELGHDNVPNILGGGFCLVNPPTNNLVSQGAFDAFKNNHY